MDKGEALDDVVRPGAVRVNWGNAEMFTGAGIGLGLGLGLGLFAGYHIFTSTIEGLIKAMLK